MSFLNLSEEWNDSSRNEPELTESLSARFPPSFVAAIYVLSGCCQPLLMTILKSVGVADPTCQLYMLYYYLCPGFFIIHVLFNKSRPSFNAASKACGIALWDLISTALNYTGAALAGPTIFAIVYSSVAIWTALLSRIFLDRSMKCLQWFFIFTVFGGLSLTALESTSDGGDVSKGLFMVVLGSIMHGLYYVMSEAVMTLGDERLTVRENCAIQNFTAASFFFIWQVVYTLPRVDEKILQPIESAGASVYSAFAALLAFGVVNAIHNVALYYTLRHYPGGATSAGVMKGLQAVLVFVFTDMAYCGRIGGSEMCFTRVKFLSLIIVVGGVIGYGMATETKKKSEYQRIYNDTDFDFQAWLKSRLPEAPSNTVESLLER